MSWIRVWSMSKFAQVSAIVFKLCPIFKKQSSILEDLGSSLFAWPSLSVLRKETLGLYSKLSASFSVSLVHVTPCSS